MDIPNHIVGLIISKSTISIDTYLEFRKFGVTPKKLIVDKGIKDKLDKILLRRVKAYDNKSYGTFLDFFSVRITYNKVIEIYIDDIDGHIIYNFEISLVDPELDDNLILRKETSNIHTGRKLKHFF